RGGGHLRRCRRANPDGEPRRPQDHRAVAATRCDAVHRTRRGGHVNRRLMFVHAHPDDESSKGAATAVHYVDDGAEVVLVTCTGGEAGEVLNPSAAHATPEEMGGIRARELAAAVAAIGFTRTYGLGYADSGYHEDPAEVPE